MDASDNETGFVLERKYGSTDWIDLAYLPADTESYLDGGLTPGGIYYYRVYAYNDTGNSDYSNEASAVCTPAGTLVVHVLDYLTLEPIEGATLFRMPEFPLPYMWGPSDAMGLIAVADYTDGVYYVSHAELDSWQPGSITVVEAGAYQEITFYGLPAGLIIPEPPCCLEAQALPGNQIALTWFDAAMDETGFYLERKQGTGAWNPLATLPPDTEAYLDSGLTAGVTYYYRVRAYAADGPSVYSNIAHATSSPLPGPADITITQISATQVRLEWSAAVSCTYYKIYAASELLPQDNPGWIYLGQTSELHYDTSSSAQRRFFLVKGVAP